MSWLEIMAEGQHAGQRRRTPCSLTFGGIRVHALDRKVRSGKKLTTIEKAQNFDTDRNLESLQRRRNFGLSKLQLDHFMGGLMDLSNYLNVGCGAKFHESWTNVDMHSTSPHVQACNLLKGFPYADNQFDVVYHSQVLEHFSKEDAPRFLAECLRVLKPGGVLRVVVPDLESIAIEYLQCLKQNIENPSRMVEANYDWILLEMYDQAVRNYSGGQMAEFLKQSELINEEYVIQRSGVVGKNIIENSRKQEASGRWEIFRTKIKRITLKRLLRHGASKLKNNFASRAHLVGSFRLSGEVHMWMYDRFSLLRLLSQLGFAEIEVLTPHKSRVPNWGDYKLDVDNGVVFDPASLFMEAIKPYSREP